MTKQVEAKVTITFYVRTDVETDEEAAAWVDAISPDEAMEEGVIEDVQREMVSCDDYEEEGNDGADA